MGLDTLQSHRNRPKLKWWYKLAILCLRIGVLISCLFRSGILNHILKGRQREVWDRMLDDLFYR